MKIADIMTRDVVCVGPQEPVRDVALAMLMRRISGIPVVDDERRVLGIVSEADLIRRPELQTDGVRGSWLDYFLANDSERARDFVRSHGLTAREIMSQPAIGIAPGATLADAVRLMQSHRIKRLPVVEERRLVGMLTRTDLVRALVMKPASPGVGGSDAVLRNRIEAILRDEPWAASAMVNVQVEDGIAHLWGTVESAAQREALVVAASGVAGIREVQAHLGRSLPG